MTYQPKPYYLTFDQVVSRLANDWFEKMRSDSDFNMTTERLARHLAEIPEHAEVADNVSYWNAVSLVEQQVMNQMVKLSLQCAVKFNGRVNYENRWDRIEADEYERSFQFLKEGNSHDDAIDQIMDNMSYKSLFTVHESAVRAEQELKDLDK